MQTVYCAFVEIEDWRGVKIDRLLDIFEKEDDCSNFITKEAEKDPEYYQQKYHKTKWEIK